MKVANACEPASARLSLQAMRLSYFKTAILPPPPITEKYNVASQSPIEAILLIKVSVRFVRCAISGICVQ